MVIAVAEITIYLFGASSLKDKRRVVRSLLQRVRNRYNASIAEVAFQDDWQRCGIGVTCVSNSGGHADEMLAEVIRFIEGNLELGSVGEVTTELIHI